MYVIIAILFVCLGVYACDHTPEALRQQELDDQANAAAEIECQKPKKVTETDGVELWEYKPSCHDHPVYFSKSGTHYTTDEPSGKFTVQVQHETSNLEKK